MNGVYFRFYSRSIGIHYTYFSYLLIYRKSTAIHQRVAHGTSLFMGRTVQITRFEEARLSKRVGTLCWSLQWDEKIFSSSSSSSSNNE